MNLKNKELKKYYKSIKKSLICDKKTKKIFLKEFTFSVDSYIATNSQATITEIEQHFGTAEDISNSFLFDKPTAYSKKVYQNHKIKIAILIILIAILTFISILTLIIQSNNRKNVVIYYNEEITEDIIVED